jgi:hypothetical protein
VTELPAAVENFAQLCINLKPGDEAGEFAMINLSTVVRKPSLAFLLFPLYIDFHVRTNEINIFSRRLRFGNLSPHFSYVCLP